jgi:hypothetical protein
LPFAEVCPDIHETIANVISINVIAVNIMAVNVIIVVPSLCYWTRQGDVAPCLSGAVNVMAVNVMPKKCECPYANGSSAFVVK